MHYIRCMCECSYILTLAICRVCTHNWRAKISVVANRAPKMTKMGARVVAQSKQRGARDAHFRHELNTTIEPSTN